MGGFASAVTALSGAASNIIGSLNQGSQIQAQTQIAEQNASLALQQSALRYQAQQQAVASSSSTIAYIAIIAGAGLIIYIVFLRKK